MSLKTTKVTHKEILKALKQSDGNKALAARTLGIPRSTVWYAAQRAGLGKVEAVPESVLVRQLRSAEQQLASATDKLKQETKRREAAEHDLSELTNVSSILDQVGSIRDVRIGRKTKGNGKSPATAIYCASDWHAESNIQSDIVNGLNEFNLDICKGRVTRFIEKCVYLTEFARGICNIRDGVLWLGGDLINGYIHQELEESNFLGPAEAVVFTSELALTCINYLFDHGDLDHLTVVCNMGNHGRSTHRTRVSTGYRSSWEYMAYLTLANRFKGDKRVTWVVPRGYFAFVDIHGWTTRFSHGDNIRYQGGVGGITIPVEKAIASWNESRRAHFDFFGHWHQFNNHWSWTSNGCLVGYDGYALSIKAKYQPPTQTFAVIDRDRGKTMALPVFVEPTASNKEKVTVA